MHAERKDIYDRGGRFLQPEDAERKRRPARRWMAPVWLMLGDGLLIYMILGGLIDRRYGVVILAGLSAYFGHKIGRRF